MENIKKPTWYYVGGFFFLIGVFASIFNPARNNGLLITYAVLSTFFFYIANKKNKKQDKNEIKKWENKENLIIVEIIQKQGKMEL